VTKDTTFAAWAPDQSIWTPWVKPVLFAHMEPWIPPERPPVPVATRDFSFARLRADQAIVVDLPGEVGIAAGLALAGAGYRPVPLYNALPGNANVIEMNGILMALLNSADHLASLPIAPDAPPAFLLDARRRGEGLTVTPGMFDNRSISLPTDFPSANVLLSRGIRRVLLIQQDRLDPQVDLAHTLRRWQEAGIEIHAKMLDDAQAPTRIDVPKPPRFRLMFYSLLALMGLRQNPMGGFGGVLPVPSAG
jgi:hypothetical protein